MQKAKQTYHLPFLRIAFILLLFLGMQYEGEALQRAQTPYSSYLEATHQYQHSSSSLQGALKSSHHSRSSIYSSRSSRNSLLFSFLIVGETESNKEDKKSNRTFSQLVGISTPAWVHQSLSTKSWVKVTPIKKLSLILLSTVVFLH